MGFNFGIRVSRGPRVRFTKSYSKGRFLLWRRKNKVKGSVRP